MPKEPDKDAVLSVNSTSVTLSFGSWPTDMCGIRSFTCQYAARDRGGGVTWIKFPRQKVDGGDTFTVGRLQPATVYTIRVFVHTDAGDASWEHTFATRTKSGGEPRDSYIMFFVSLPLGVVKWVTTTLDSFRSSSSQHTPAAYT